MSTITPRTRSITSRWVRGGAAEVWRRSDAASSRYLFFVVISTNTAPFGLIFADSCCSPSWYHPYATHREVARRYGVTGTARNTNHEESASTIFHRRLVPSSSPRRCASLASTHVVLGDVCDVHLTRCRRLATRYAAWRTAAVDASESSRFENESVSDTGARSQLFEDQTRITSSIISRSSPNLVYILHLRYNIECYSMWWHDMVL
jgi:hypothetical protein